DAEGDYSYAQLSKNANPLASTAGKPYQLFQGSLDAGYELDLWGRLRRGLEAAEGEEAAGEEDRKTVEITVVADSVEADFGGGVAEAALAIAREARDVRRRTLDIVVVRHDSGIANDLELRRAEGELKAAEAEVPEAERLRAIA